MVRAATVYRSQDVRRHKGTAGCARITPMLREGRRSAPSLLDGTPTMERHDQPSAMGSASEIWHGRTVGAWTWLRGAEHLSGMASTCIVAGTSSLRRVGARYARYQELPSFEAVAGTVVAKGDTGMASALVSVSAEDGAAAAMCSGSRPPRRLV